MEINNKILISLLLGIGTCLTTAASLLAIVRELENVNEKIKIVEKKIGRNPMKEVKTKPLPTKYIFNLTL